MSGHDQPVEAGRTEVSGTDEAGERQPTTDDAFLGGALTIRQPRSGYRAGLDAVLLAASVTEEGGSPDGLHILDAGAGVGTVGLCLAHRIGHATVTLVEIQPDKAALAAFNAARNGLSERVTAVTADVTASSADLVAAGLLEGAYDVVVMNPPYHDARAGTAAADPGRSTAHAMAMEHFDDWLRFAVRSLKPRGRVHLVHTGSALPDILAAMSGRFGGVVVKPVLARAGEDAIRVLVAGTKGSRAPFRISAPFVVHDAGRARGFTAEAEAILRDGAALARWT